MSRARLVITAVVVEGRTHADVAAQYGLSRSWVTRLVARYRAEGPAAFEARSRRPNTTPTAISPEVVELVVNLRSELAAQGLDAGPHTICWHLAQRHQITVSPATVRRRLVELGLVEANPKKRPRSSYTRFEADLPNECWQSDFCRWALADGSTVEVITWLDDCSRYALSVTAHRRITGPIAAATFDHTCADHGIPASTLTDNAMVYTTRLSGGKGGRNALESRLAALGVAQKNSKPNCPTTCGKVERFQQTLKKWLKARTPPHSLDQLQTQIDEFTRTYNHHRPHRSLGRSTPAAAYTRLPKATPHQNSDRTHYRVRRDRIDKSGTVTIRHNGKLHHIGIGRAHKHTPVILLVDGTHTRVIDHTTGELLRQPHLDPTRDHQPRHKN
ncbi:IS481 family transposase [Candidatus Poriferisocius sp.]|uniref:IS481 family transposase n=1 Tax=Candidatus Poriferisocius sp. TaxID=3101276 RepID=UPI003B02BBC6